MVVHCHAPSSPRAREVLAILERGEYVAHTGQVVRIAEAQAAAELGTVTLTPEALAELRARSPSGARSMRVEVIAATTQDAAHELAAHDADAALLNFASAREPGGGFLDGARAQEEDLCRCSGLFRALITQPLYYQVHRAERSLLYTDHLIYSPRVPFFRVAGEAPLLPVPFLCSVITAPAPNAGAIARSQPERTGELEATFERRWANVLAVAEARGHATLLLGAWGCGAFRNDPRVVARTVKRVLSSARFAGAFDRVVFAIPSGGRSEPNLIVFRDELATGD